MTEIVKIATSKMIAASIVIEINSTDEAVDAGDAAAREGGFWDDYEEEW